MSIKDLIFSNNENIYNNFPDAIIVLDFLRNIIVWNKKAELLFGYSKSEVKNKNITIIFKDNFEQFNKIIGLNHGTILSALTKTGEEIFVDVTAYDVSNSAKTIVSIRALSNKFLELQSLLDDYQATKILVTNRDNFLSNLKFDIITPLNAAIGFSQSLLDKVCGDINEKQEKYINIINSNNKKIKNILEKVFDIITLDTNKREFTYKTFDFIGMLNFVIENHQNTVNQKGLKIIKHIETEKRTAYGDEYAFSEIISIIMSNAVKFTNNGEITINVTHPDNEILEFHNIKIPKGYTEKSYIRIDIADTGCGIKEENITDIFDEYMIKNLLIAQKNDGTALSLPIARKLVEKLNGVIFCCNNEDNLGTLFTVILPIEKMSFD